MQNNTKTTLIKCGVKYLISSFIGKEVVLVCVG